MDKKGFTIIELGIVIIMMALIVSGLTPILKKVKEKAFKIRCVNNLQKISIAMRVYSLENNNSAPKTLGELYTKGYLDSEKAFDCPFSPERGAIDNPDYDYDDKFNFSMPGNLPIVFDKKTNHPDESRNFLCINGEIKNR